MAISLRNDLKKIYSKMNVRKIVYFEKGPYLRQDKLKRNGHHFQMGTGMIMANGQWPVSMAFGPGTQ